MSIRAVGDLIYTNLEVKTVSFNFMPLARHFYIRAPLSLGGDRTPYTKRARLPNYDFYWTRNMHVSLNHGPYSLKLTFVHPDYISHANVAHVRMGLADGGTSITHRGVFSNPV